jgi:copper chaperone CopZ
VPTGIPHAPGIIRCSGSTKLFKKCQEIGIIPRSEAELVERTQESPTTIFPQADLIQESDYQESTADESSLSLSLNVTLMWCPACAWVIEEILTRTPGVISASCNFATDRVRCDYNPVLTSPHQIVDSINSLGYKAYVSEDDVDTGERRAEFIRLLISAFLTMNVMMLSFALYSGFFTQLSRLASFSFMAAVIFTVERGPESPLPLSVWRHS